MFGSLRAGTGPLEDVVRAAVKYHQVMDTLVDAADTFVDSLAKVRSPRGAIVIPTHNNDAARCDVICCDALIGMPAGVGAGELGAGRHGGGRTGLPARDCQAQSGSMADAYALLTAAQYVSSKYHQMQAFNEIVRRRPLSHSLTHSHPPTHSPLQFIVPLQKRLKAESKNLAKMEARPAPHARRLMCGRTISRACPSRTRRS